MRPINVLQMPEVASTGMLIIATIGLLVNILVAWILMRGGDTKENLNIRAAFLHVIGDALGSVGAIIAALMILFFNWGWADQLASVIVAVLVLISGWRVTKDAVHVLMEGTPKNVEIDAVIKTIESIPGVNNMHDACMEYYKWPKCTFMPCGGRWYHFYSGKPGNSENN